MTEIKEKKKKMNRDEQIEDIRMTLEEARVIRLQKQTEANKKNPNANQESELKRRQAFQEFWAMSRRAYGRPEKEIEDILWAHLKAIKHDNPEKFDAGIKHFGLKKINTKRSTNL